MSTGNWRDRAGSGLLGPNDPHGNPITTSLDRRWLWRLECDLAVSATNDGQRQLASDLRQYLNETCEHHWMFYGAEENPDGIGAHRQCLWCNAAEFGDDPGSHYVTFDGEDWQMECPAPHPHLATNPIASALRRFATQGTPTSGRWRIAGWDGAIPILERANDKPAAGAA